MTKNGQKELLPAGLLQEMWSVLLTISYLSQPWKKDVVGIVCTWLVGVWNTFLPSGCISFRGIFLSCWCWNEQIINTFWIELWNLWIYCPTGIHLLLCMRKIQKNQEDTLFGKHIPHVATMADTAKRANKTVINILIGLVLNYNLWMHNVKLVFVLHLCRTVLKSPLRNGMLFFNGKGDEVTGQGELLFCFKNIRHIYGT